LWSYVLWHSNVSVRRKQLLPVLQKAGYTHHFRSGPGKLHGCIIAYKAQRFSLVAEKVVYYDEERVRTDGSELGQRGVSFNTRNIGIIVALKANNNQNDSLVIATTHLFWHPKYVIPLYRIPAI
jgi:RNA exonuclease NGL2